MVVVTSMNDLQEKELVIHPKKFQYCQPLVRIVHIDPCEPAFQYPHAKVC